jgi:hypothetical protein
MRTPIQERITLLERNYFPLKGYQEQTLTMKKANFEKYLALATGLFSVIFFFLIGYFALTDIVGWEPNNWTKTGLVVGNGLGLYVIFSVFSRNGLILPHFIRLKEVKGDINFHYQEVFNQLNTNLMKLIKDRSLIPYLVVIVLINFFSISYFLVESDGGEGIIVQIWDYMKFVVPVLYGVALTKHLVLLYKIYENIRKCEKLVRIS